MNRMFFFVLYEGVDTLEELCYWHDALLHEENVVLGKDWVVVYAKRKDEIDCANELVKKMRTSAFVEKSLSGKQLSDLTDFSSLISPGVKTYKKHI